MSIKQLKVMVTKSNDSPVSATTSLKKKQQNKSIQNLINTNKQKHHLNEITICIDSAAHYAIIGIVAKSLEWKLVNVNDLWNIYWTDSILGSVEFCRAMKRFQKINHFPGMIEICRKDLLARNMNRMLRLFPNDYQIFPKTWCFPADLGDAIQYSKLHKNKTFILKPGKYTRL